MKQNHHQIDFMFTIFTLPVVLFTADSVVTLLKCVFGGKCPLVNMLHIFGTPIRKYTTGGLLVGEIISMSTFLV